MNYGKPLKKPWSYKDWYAANKEELSKKRKEKYDNDSEHREKVLEQNRVYRANKAKEESKVTDSMNVPGIKKPITMQVLLHGALVVKKLVHIGTLAAMIQRSVATIRQWERSGVLPKTPFISGENKQERLYTEEMARVVKEAIGPNRRKISIKNKDFTEQVVKGWEKLGVQIKE
jgi:hypothetical protein